MRINIRQEINTEQSNRFSKDSGERGDSMELKVLRKSALQVPYRGITSYLANQRTAITGLCQSAETVRVIGIPQ
jgi:hypothetical protein